VHTLRPWLGTLARVIVAAVWIAAGASKIGDLAASGRAVNAYELFPVGAGRVIGAALPLVELTIGTLLLLGVATRLAAWLSAALLASFTAAIGSAWARGLSIDCGCFGGGGALGAGQHPTYGWEIARDLALFAAAVFVAIWPETRLSIDGNLREEPT
jgi:uncharacterized membrane protein YphA (DoxX/SURF4 family)